MGGVGTVAAYTLQLGGAEVTSVIRSDYDIVIEKGYKINSPDFGLIEGYRPSHIAKTAKEANEKYGPFDYVVVTTKNIPDLNNVEDIYADAVSQNTVIVLQQNGLGIEKAAFERFPGHIVLSGVSMISSANYNGEINQTGGDSLAVGYFDNGVNTPEEQLAKAEEFVALYKKDQNQCFIDKDSKYTRWRKLVYNAVFNTIATVTNLDVGRLEEFGAADGLIFPAMDEVIAMAASDGVTLDPSIKQLMYHSDDGDWYAPSMLVDLRKGNQIECEVILGNALRIAKKNGVKTPILDVIYELLKLTQMSIKEKRGLIKLPEVRPIEDPEGAAASRAGY